MHVRLPLVLATLVLAPVSLAAGNLPQFPKKVPGAIEGSAVVADLTGEPAVVVATGNRLFAFGLDGRPIKGYPVALGAEDEAVVGDLAAADMDGDGLAEVAAATRGGRLYVVSKGVVATGFPVSLGEGCAAGPSFADLDGDGRAELVQGDRAGALHALKANGRPMAPFPVALGEPLTSSPSVGQLRGQLVVAIGSEKGRVHVVDAKGARVPGFPLVTHFTVSGAPAFGDVDDDGEVDLVAASRDFNLYAVDGQGKLLRGFPFTTGHALGGSPALADVDGDDVLDIVAASLEGKLYVVSGAGKTLPGFPVKPASNIPGGVAVGDLDRDGRVDLVVASREGRVHVVGPSGKEPGGSPQKVGLNPGTPFLARLKDGAVAAFVGGADGNLVGLRFETKAPGTQGAIPWAGAGHGAARTGRYFPNPLRYKDLTIAPEGPRVEDTLAARWAFFSVDGLPEPPAPVAWLRNNQRVKELDGKREVPPRTAKKGERWRFELQVGARVVRSPEVVIQNSAPAAPQVRISPAEPTVKGNAKLEVVTPSQDADGDKVTYRVGWLLDGKRTDLTGETLPAARLKKGQRWTAVVVPFDGQLEGALASAEVTVVNAPPGAPRLAMEPKVPRKGQAVAPVVQAQAQDPDGDPVQYRYRWSVDGERVNYPPAQATLPLEPFRKGNRVKVEVTAWDGKAEGEAWQGEVQVANTPPPAPKVAIVPAEPRAGQALRALVREPSRDADADAVTYRAAWTRNGKPFSPAGEPFEVPASEVKKGDRWTVSLTPNDGEADGQPGTAEITLRNTPPTRPTVALKPERPTTGGGIEVVIVEPAKDVDGDPVNSTFVWTRDGKPVEGKGQRLALGPKEFKKHERIRVVVTPSDGAQDGPAGVAEVKVENALPGAPVVALEPAAPTNQGPLEAVIRTPAPDTDGDAIQYRYTWLRNGAPQPFPESQAKVPASTLVKGDHWVVIVRASDGEALGPAMRASVRIGNAPPPAPKVALSPQTPRRGKELRAVLTEAVDPDGDVLSYRYAWRRDGAPVALGPTAAAVPAELPKKGELWSVEVIANDGAADSKPARAEVRIANTPPGLAVVTLCEGPVPAGAPLEVKVVTPSADADGDAVTYRYEWTVNGQPQPKWTGRTTLGAGDTRKHDKLRVTVTPGDGTESGPSATADCEVEDTAPEAPVASLDPPEPTAETGLKVKVPQPPGDRDGDRISYRYAWMKNGLPFQAEGDGAAVKPGALVRGDELRVVVTSWDGERNGGEATLTAKVRNTPPPAPKVTLTPAEPVTGEKLTCTAKAPAADVDGDAVRVHIRWLRSGEVTPIAEGQTELPERTVKKGERWRCEAWSDDGFALSARAGAEVAVKNSPPTAPKVVIEPEEPGVGSELTCRVAGDALDPDGDPVRYRYQWHRNGKPETALDPPFRVPGERTRKGDTWRCTVVASDGAQDGPAATVEKALVNTPPGVARVAIEPKTPAPGQPLRCELLDPATDPDGDKIQHRYFWIKDGVEQSFAPTSVQVPGRLVKSKELWSCEVQATDGKLDGPRANSGTVVVR